MIPVFYAHAGTDDDEGYAYVPHPSKLAQVLAEIEAEGNTALVQIHPCPLHPNGRAVTGIVHHLPAADGLAVIPARGADAHFVHLDDVRAIHHMTLMPA